MEVEGVQFICFMLCVINLMMEYDWLGNVCEFVNLVECMVILYLNSLVDVNYLLIKYCYSDILEFQLEFSCFSLVEE